MKTCCGTEGTKPWAGAPPAPCVLLWLLAVLLWMAATAGTVAADTVSVRLAWDAVANTETQVVVGYRVYYGQSSRAYRQVGETPDTQYLVEGVDPDKPIYFAVSAYSETAESGFSRELACAVIRQSISGAGSIVGAQSDWGQPRAEPVFVVERDTGKSVIMTVTVDNAWERIMALRVNGLWLWPVAELVIPSIKADHTVHAVVGAGLPPFTGLKVTK